MFQVDGDVNPKRAELSELILSQLPGWSKLNSPLDAFILSAEFNSR